MPPDLLTKAATAIVDRKGYKGGRDSIFTVLMAAGVWLASEMRHDVSDIKAGQASFEKRLSALEHCEEQFKEINARLSRLEVRGGNGSSRELWKND